MRMRCTAFIVLLMFVLLVLPLTAQIDRSIKVLFVGGDGSVRNEEFKALLDQYFDSVAVITYSDFYFYHAENFDVLMMDYTFRMKHVPQQIPEDWSMPTILINSGDMILGSARAAKINWL